MMNSIKFWKEHTTLRMIIMAVTFVLGIVLLIFGWMQTGQMWGLVVMLVGVVSLMITLWIYNKPFSDPPKSKDKK